MKPTARQEESPSETTSRRLGNWERPKAELRSISFLLIQNAQNPYRYCTVLQNRPGKKARTNATLQNAVYKVFISILFQHMPFLASTKLSGPAGEHGYLQGKKAIHELCEGIKTQAGLTITHSHWDRKAFHFTHRGKLRLSQCTISISMVLLKAILRYAAT